MNIGELRVIEKECGLAILRRRDQDGGLGLLIRVVYETIASDLGQSPEDQEWFDQLADSTKLSGQAEARARALEEELGRINEGAGS